jgi:GTP pyrophosphokinase
VDVAWDVDEKDNVFTGRLHLVVANEPGSLGSLSTIIGKNLGNISNLKITHRSQDFFEMLIDVQVVDAKHLTNIIAALRAMPEVTTVERARG